MIIKKNQPQGSGQTTDEGDVLVLGKNFNIVGDVMGDGIVIISGRMDGNITGGKVVSETGSFVMGNIRCAQLDVAGFIRGSILATDVILRKSAVIEGELQYSTLGMEQGCEVLGRLKKISDSSQEPIIAAESSQSIGNQFIPFPEDVITTLKNSTSPLDGLVILTHDGQEPPQWITKSPDDLGLLILTNELEGLINQNKKLFLRVVKGSVYCDISIP